MSDRRVEQTNGLSQYPSVTLIAQLVQKYLFTTISKDGKLLTKCGLTFLDLNGRSLDLDVWSSGDWTKAQYLYRKLKANNVYKLTNCSRFIPTDAKFSNSQFRIANVRGLWVEPHVDEVFNPRNYVPCTTSSSDAARLINERGTANIMATFIARHRGPRKILGESRETREPVANGHLVEFEDKNSVRFYVLLWQPKNIKAPYHLFGAEPGEIMLIPNCRAFTRPLESSYYVKDSKATHFTTLCHAVSNSLAVAPEKFRELRRRVPARRDENSNNRAITSHDGGDNNRATIDQPQFLGPTDARLVGSAGSLQQPQAFNRVSGQLSLNQGLPLAHQASLSPLNKYQHGQQQQTNTQPNIQPTNATLNGSNNATKQQTLTEIDDKLKRFNIHQLRTLAKHKSISTSINKDPMIEKIKSVYRFKNVQEVTDTLNTLSSNNQRPYPYALLDVESNPVLIEIRKLNNRFDTVLERIDAIEKCQKDIREALGLICNQTTYQFKPVGLTSTNQSQRNNRNSDFHG